jgi:transcriptional regulator with XRE-family HTH domain
MNERLRAAMIQADVTLDDLHDATGVDRKTIERWISKGRVPHESNRRASAKKLGVTETYLWPELLDRQRALLVDDAKTSLVCTYDDRASVPRDVWLRLVQAAEQHIPVLVYSGTFLTQTNPRLPKMLAERTRAGTQVRLCFADPDGTAVAQRDEEEGLHGTLGSKIRASLSYFTALSDLDGCEVRLHNTTVYASIFRYDDQALINPHIWGSPASANPIQHLRRIGNECPFEKYTASFDRVWEQSKPWYPNA